MATAVALIESTFPNLRRNGYQLSSPDTPTYNCIAWAAGASDKWWWPGPFSYWPAGVPREVSLAAFVAAFETLGYEQTGSGRIAKTYEKIAIFVDSNGVPTHAARQLRNGVWVSKLGAWEDIEHSSAKGVEGSAYGKIIVYMRRKIV